MEITVAMKVSEEILGDLLICAIEGGSNYWLGQIRPTRYKDPNNGLCWYENIFKQHGELEVVDAFGDSDPKSIDYEKSVAALEVMFKKHPYLLDDYLSDNMDADFADLWLQYTAYGECVYS